MRAGVHPECFFRCCFAITAVSLAIQPPFPTGHQALGVAVVALPVPQISDDRDAYEAAVEIFDPKWTDFVVTREFRQMIC